MKSENVIEINDLTVRYGRTLALQQVSGSFHRGSLTAIAGPNGAGKSTLLKAITGILKPTSGKVSVDPTATLAYLPQASTMQKDFPMTVLQCVCTGFFGLVGNSRSINASMQARAIRALAEVGLQGFNDRLIGDLSGGEFQRVLFARLNVQDGSVLLLDEPFVAVDAVTTIRLIQLVLNWHKQGRTVICVLHDLLLIQKYFPDSFVLSGKCLGHGHTHNLLEQKLLSFDLDMAELCPGPETEAHHHHEMAEHTHHD
jgi:zinc/manganese transport system ATP-binding protein